MIHGLFTRYAQDDDAVFPRWRIINRRSFYGTDWESGNLDGRSVEKLYD